MQGWTFANELDRFLVEMPVPDQAIPNLLEELAHEAPAPKPDEMNDPASATYTANGTDLGSTHGTGFSRRYRTLPPPRPPRTPLPTLIGIFCMVFAAVLIVGRVVIRHQTTSGATSSRLSSGQSSSARSVSTKR